ncbi:MAG: hypothetical protein FWD97_07700, partial [Defluviitaleaceae bacterium]|nr:hypothetical protein [Defluviitaleaceae bacterium]
MYSIEVTSLVGAGIARPMYADDTVQPKIIVPTEMGRAMPAPTIMVGQVIGLLFETWVFLS